MNLVEIDPIRAEALEAGFGGGDEVAAGGALHGSGLVHGAAEFGGEDDALAVLAEDLAEDGFRTAALAVDIGGIEEHDAQVDGLVNDLCGKPLDRCAGRSYCSQCPRRRHPVRHYRVCAASWRDPPVQSRWEAFSEFGTGSAARGGIPTFFVNVIIPQHLN